MRRTKRSLVRFSMPPQYSRLLSDEEHYVLQIFTKHMQRCDRCYISHAAPSRVMSVCSNGFSYACDLQQYITFRDGTAYSTFDIGQGGKPMRIEIVDSSLSSDVLRVLQNGFRVDQAGSPGQQLDPQPIPGRGLVTPSSKSQARNKRTRRSITTIDQKLAAISGSLARLESAMTCFLTVSSSKAVAR
jgi:hypothetical protein